MKSQIRFAANASKFKKELSKTKLDTDLSLSNEMKTWLQNSINSTDDDGYLVESVSSSLAQPLDSFSAFCPTGSLLSSKYSSVRVPSPVKKQTNSKSSLMEKGESVDFSSAVNRLNVMWLNRKAQLEKEEGNLNASYNTLQEALNIHLGTVDYESINLTEHAGTDDPLQMIIDLEEKYFQYDFGAHQQADRIQRWYHRFFLQKRSALAVLIRSYRNYLRRKRDWLYFQRRLQCCLKIQKRFRIHLRRMHQLATKIKMWYKLMCDMRVYRGKIHIYRLVRRVQRLFRGIQGRLVSMFLRYRLSCVRKIQVNIRGFLKRKYRAFAITQYHKVYYRSALKIQCFVRRILSIGRAKYRLLLELLREDDRIHREEEVREETIRLEMSRVRLYLLTDPGQLHLKRARDKLIAEDEEFEKIKPTITASEILAREAHVMFELFDSDGSGSIDRSELKQMLIELCISLRSDEIEALASELDFDCSGDIDFSEFAAWYCGGDTGSKSFGGGFFRQILRARRAIMDLSGQTIALRTERAVLRQCCSWLSSETKALFRMNCPPKYNCCRCLKPFVLFTDYLSHFVGKEKRCPVTKEKALFYQKFWRREDWLKQRQCESEVMRHKEEYPCLSYKAMLAAYSEISLQSNKEVKDILQTQIQASAEIYLGKLIEYKTSDKSRTMSYSKGLPEIIYEVADICADGYLSPNVVYCVAECLGEKVPNEWVVNDVWEFNMLSNWLRDLAQLQRPQIQSRGMCNICDTPLAKVLKRDAKILGGIMVRCIRILMVGVESSLIALSDYRRKRPRR